MATLPYEFDDLYIPSYDLRGSVIDTTDALPREETTICYEEIKVKYAREELDLRSFENESPEPMVGLLLPAIQAVVVGVNHQDISPSIWYDL